MSKPQFLTLLFFFILVLVSVPAHAYLDPATGSLALQAILAIVAAVLISVKGFWHRIRSFFVSTESEDGGSDTDNES